MYTAIGDIVLSTEELAYPYLTKLIKIYKAAFLQIALKIKNQPESIDEIDKLKLKVVESFSCIHVTFKRNP